MKKFFTVFVVLALLAIGSSSLFGIIQVGEEVAQKFETAHPYAGVKGVLWEQEFHYPDAGYIAIHFSEFDLAKGDILEISSPDGKYYYEYKEKGKKIKNRKTNTEEMISVFWATHIPGETAIVRLIGKNKNSGNGFVIDKWVRGYERGFIEAVMSGAEEDEFANIEAICSSDDKEWAKCYLGTDMYNKSKAVCRLLLNGSSACTGWLLGSEGHVMTNEHCIGNQTTASNTDFEFMAEGASCATDCTGWFACPGTVEASSATLIQVDAALDFALVLLPSNLTSTYGYMQLRDTLPSLDERIYIPQHPSANGKMFAVLSDTDGPYAKIYSTNEAPCSGGPGDIGYYADTEGGSSGSPVLGYNDNLVVALHHCANCPNRGVPIPSIITDLGSNLPNDAIGGGTPPAPPTADFSANTTTLPEGQSVNFTDLSTNSPTSWSWTFNGGTPSSSTSQNPTVTYNTAGTYTVSLTATNTAGNDTETKTNYITVTASLPTVGNTTVFGSTSTSGYRRAMPFTMPEDGTIDSVAMYHTGGSGSMILAVYDGASAPQNMLGVTASTAVSGSTGWQTINLISPTFVANGSTVWLAWVYESNPGIRYQTGSPGRYQSTATWSGGMPDPFGSGSQADYLYSIYANYTAGGGTVNPPVANFSGTPTTLDEGQSVSFTDLSTNTPTSWSWSFTGGTPSTSTAQNPTITYNTAGTYSVTLTATNSAGSDGETKTNYITVEVPTITYCTSSGNNQSYEWIAGVQVGSLNNSSGASGYTDFTGMTVNLTKGVSASVTLTPGFASSSYSEYWKIWVDLNHDGDFTDTGEEVFSGYSSGSVTGNLTIPTSATNGTTRMRVTMQYNSYPSSSCGTFTYGEVEDYTVNIQ